MWICADIFGRDVTSAERVDETAVRAKDRLAIDAATIAKHDGFPAAEWQTGERILVSHAPRQAQQIMNDCLVVRIAPKAGAANRRTEFRAVNGDKSPVVPFLSRSHTFVF